MGGQFDLTGTDCLAGFYYIIMRDNGDMWNSSQKFSFQKWGLVPTLYKTQNAARSVAGRRHLKANKAFVVTTSLRILENL